MPSTQPGWRRSSYCSTNGCLETSFAEAGEVLVRDSKVADGPILVFSAAAWQDFAASVRAGEFSTGDASR